MFAVVHLPQFALQAALRHEPEAWSQPVALVDPARTKPAVCDVTEPALAVGVTLGLTPTQALARCTNVSIRHRRPAHETAATEAMLQCAYGFSPHLEATAAGVTTLDLRGLAVLSGADDAARLTWAGQLRTAMAALHLRARVGIGATPQLALHAARWTDGIQLVGDARAFIDDLPVAALDPSSDVAEILHKWGLRTVGEVLALGQAELAERLGLEALALFAAASTMATRPLRLVTPREEFEEAMDFEHPVEQIEPLLFLLRRFVDQLCVRLELSAEVATVQTLRLRLESGETLERRLAVPQPTRRADVLFRMLHTHLETLRTDAPISAVRLAFERRVPEQKQFGLFEAALRDPHQFQETLARLVALVGADRVGTPVLEDSHRPDAFRLVPPDFENAPATKTRRTSDVLRPVALRRFRPVLKAKVQSARADADVVPRPVSVRCSVAHGELTVTVGPWRASGQWWEPGAWQREEWDVATRDGAVLRLSRRDEGWFVEGVLD